MAKPIKMKTPSSPKKKRPQPIRVIKDQDVQAAKRGRGRPKSMTDKEAGEKRRGSALKYQRKIDQAGRDIAGEEWQALLHNIDWDRRLATKYDLRLFCETYLSGVFYLGWSDDQKRCVQKTETVFLDDAMFAVAMPRGGGKTAIARGGLIWGTLHGHKRFPFNVGSTDPKSLQTLDAIRANLYASPLLLQDFPEICWAVKKTENRFHLAKGQLFYGFNTFIDWGSSSIRYPSLLLPQEDAQVYLDHDPDSVVYREEYDAWLPVNAGINISTAGIGGAIRGEAETNPITLEQPRPDVVILDDIQKDQAAESPAQVDKLTRLVEGAVAGLAGPGRHISVMKPCTVTREGDLSDTFLDPHKKPEYRGERCQLVSKWPDGITDFEITMETESGKLWNKYGEERRESFRNYERHSTSCRHCRDNLTNPCKKGLKLQNAATAFYKKNRRKMDKGFIVSWSARYGNPTMQADGTIVRDTKELSAQQHAMNLRFKTPQTFAAEYQNRGRKLVEEGGVMISAAELRAKSLAGLPRRSVPADCQHLAAFVDVQNECLFYCVLALAPDFTGAVVDYGTFPQIKTRYFTKGQVQGWSYLTREFFKAYPEQKDKATKTKSGKLRAPLEAKIYHALGQCVPWLFSLDFIKQDEHATPMKIQRIGIDTRWGQASNCIKQYIKESGIRDLVPYYGQPFPATNKQLEEYTMTKGWFFEQQCHPNIKDPKWVIRPNPDGQFYMAADVNRLKDFVMARLASPPGSPGCISLFEGTEDEHEMFADHVCNSEYPEPVSARGRTKNQWLTREGRPDNDWLDCLVGCCAVASLLGACLQTGGEAPVRKRTRKLSDRVNAKRNQRRDY